MSRHVSEQLILLIFEVLQFIHNKLGIDPVVPRLSLASFGRILLPSNHPTVYWSSHLTLNWGSETQPLDFWVAQMVSVIWSEGGDFGWWFAYFCSVALDESLSDEGVWMKLTALPWDSTWMSLKTVWVARETNAAGNRMEKNQRRMLTSIPQMNRPDVAGCFPDQHC